MVVVSSTSGKACALGPLLVTADPVAMDFGTLLKGPSRARLLGTDQFGRDVLARLVWGARLSVSIGALAVALALAVGVPIGALSGDAGGAVDNVLMRCMDALLAFPALLLALGLVAIMGPGSTSTTLAIGIVYTPGVARLTRGVVLAERRTWRSPPASRSRWRCSAGTSWATACATRSTRG
jgi:peptide/nickel transport system permease protein